MFQTSVARLVDDNRAPLALEWVVGRGRGLIERDPSESAATVGHLNTIHPNRVQVLGPHEVQHLQALGERDRDALLESVLGAQPAALIVADGLDCDPRLTALAERFDITVLSTPHAAPFVIDKLRRYLARELAESTTRHGVFMDVLGVGVLITGDSGTGKSELGLELISRGAGLVADDVVEITRISMTTLEGHCPPLLRDFLEVRGLGVLNIRAVYGETSIRPKMILRLIVHLDRPQPGQAPAERLPLGEMAEDVLGVTVSKVVIPVAAGRNLAVLLEAAVRNWVLKRRGIDSTQDFIRRQQAAMKADSAE
jgi:HPr kinase/phosphorylase